MHQGGVKFNKEEEERCPKVSPLTLDGVLKALVESKGGERREKAKKRNRAEIEEPKDQPHAAVFKEGASSEEMWGYEAYSEQQVLTPTADQGTPAQIGAEERGKQKVVMKKAAPLSC